MNTGLSIIILTRNEAANIADCIRSAQWADEILVYDSGSTDATAEIAGKLGARIVTDETWEGFGRQRQKAQDAAGGGWLFMLDADERVTPELRESLQAACAGDERQFAYAVSRSSYFFGRFIRHSGWYPDRVVRLYHRDSYRYNDALVHERVDCPDAQVRNLDGDLLHYTCTDFREFVTKSNRYAADWARERYARGKRASLSGAVGHAIGCFFRKYLLQRGFLDGRHGFLLAVLSGQYVFNKYAALWALQQRERDER